MFIKLQLLLLSLISIHVLIIPETLLVVKRNQNLAEQCFNFPSKAAGMYVCIHTYKYVHIYTYICMYVFICVCIYVCAYTYIYMFACVYVYVIYIKNLRQEDEKYAQVSIANSRDFIKSQLSAISFGLKQIVFCNITRKKT